MTDSRMDLAPFFKAGEQVVLREWFGGAVFSARPEIVVQNTADLLALYIPAGTQWKQPGRSSGGRVAIPGLLTGDWALFDAVWTGSDCLRLTIPGAPYSVLVFWTEDHTAVSRWYINLEEPLHRTAVGFDFLDTILDINVAPDLSEWHWKDQDELEDAVAYGLFTPEKARRIAAYGRKALDLLCSGSSPFTPWATWKPNPNWPIPELRPGWDVHPTR